MDIKLEVVSHNLQRYATCGDWFWRGSDLVVRASRMSQHKYEFLVTLHELVEAMLCVATGVMQDSVDEFDRRFEERRQPNDKDSEPGDDPAAPYRREHAIASVVERLAADLLGVDFNRYSKEIAEL